MIKALIVDDEYLIRKGLVLTLPWEKLDIEIVGEAESAKKAIEFISKNEVDLLLTDITMPEMSGFELIREVNEKHPGILMVVITCHRDFNLIQKALRLGAIDYIVKTELDDNELEENLKRISERVKFVLESKETMAMHDFSSFGNQKFGILLVPRHYEYDTNDITELICFKDEVLMEMGDGNLLYMINRENCESCIRCMKDSEIYGKWVLSGIRNIDKVGREKLNDFIYKYIANELVYSYTYGSFIEIDALKNENIVYVIEVDKLSMLKKEWSNILWVINNDEFNRLKASTVSLKPDMARLKNIFNNVMIEWESCLSIEISKSFYEEIEEAKFWVDYEIWMNGFRIFVAEKINRSLYPEETVSVILNALDYMKVNFTEDISQDNISKSFNLSRSYFSRVFKDILGINYIEYLKNLRLERAKDLLLQSNKPIYQISNDVGFIDEKYFSRIFKGKTGLNPAEYRNTKYNKCY